MRILPLVLLVVLAGCDSRPVTPERRASDSSVEPWYGQTVDELTGLNRQAKELFRRGKSNEAAALITEGEPMSSRLLSVPHPTLAATEAASDLDELYARMLFSNRNYGWARLLFQKNLARWKYWRPQTRDTVDRLKQAEASIAECDRQMESESAR